MTRSIADQTESQLGGSRSVLVRQKRDHVELDRLLHAIDKSTGPHRGFREDVRDEEDVLLPKLQDKVSPKQLRQIGIQWEVVRRTAPTRPHPVVARRPPGNVLAALPLTILDRGRDQLDRASLRTHGSTSARLRTVSGALAGAAGRIEHLPLLTRGDRAETHRE
ncbi:hemerythrin domain-containing protein [Williamsia sp. R60]